MDLRSERVVLRNGAIVGLVKATTVALQLETLLKYEMKIAVDVLVTVRGAKQCLTDTSIPRCFVWHWCSDIGHMFEDIADIVRCSFTDDGKLQVPWTKREETE